MSEDKIMHKGREIVGTRINPDNKPVAIPKTGPEIPLTPEEYQDLTEKVKKA
jgi:hypothetical protein